MPTWVPPWFINGVLGIVLAGLFLGLYAFANRLLGSELSHFLQLLKNEWQDSSEGKVTVGSANWRGFLTVSGIGILVMVVTSFQKLAGMLATIVGVKQAEQLISATNFPAMFYFLAVFLLLSLVVVIVDNRARRE